MIGGHSSIRAISIKKVQISICYTSNEKYHFCLSTDIFKSDNKCKIRKWELEKLVFFILHISTKNVLDGLRFSVHVGNIPFKGAVSQILY